MNEYIKLITESFKKEASCISTQLDSLQHNIENGAVKIL